MKIISQPIEQRTNCAALKSQLFEKKNVIFILKALLQAFLFSHDHAKIITSEIVSCN